jgi:hypothetical protein
VEDGHVLRQQLCAADARKIAFPVTQFPGNHRSKTATRVLKRRY